MQENTIHISLHCFLVYIYIFRIKLSLWHSRLSLQNFTLII